MNPIREPQHSAPAELRDWEQPRLQRLDAGSAEAGANPIAPEGAFASGDPVS